MIYPDAAHYWINQINNDQSTNTLGLNHDYTINEI